MAAPRYPVVLFDVGDTLLGPRQSYGTTYARVLADLGRRVPASALDRAIFSAAAALSSGIPRGADRFAYFPEGEIGYWQRFVERVFTLVGDRPVPHAVGRGALGPLREAFLDASAWHVYDDVIPVLDALRSAGVRLGIVSNWDSRLPAVLEATGLADRFDALAVSHLEGVEKPDPRLFYCALERLGARPEEALHVGNAPELDLDGARAAGVRGLLIDRAARRPRSAEAFADLTPVLEIARSGGEPNLSPWT
jgi:putative hydrolase of the HAD superfamily